MRRLAVTGHSLRIILTRMSNPAKPKPSGRPVGKPGHLSPYRAAQIYWLRYEGLSVRKIADRVGIHYQSTIKRLRGIPAGTPPPKWCNQYKPKPPGPRKKDDPNLYLPADVLARYLQSLHKGEAYRSMARRLGVDEKRIRVLAAGGQGHVSIRVADYIALGNGGHVDLLG